MVDTRTSMSGGTGAADEAYCATCGTSYAAGTVRCPQDGGTLVNFRSTQDPWIGRVLDGRYEIRSAIGAGGMGAVYRGKQLTMDREVAIKVIKSTVVADREVAKRFLREARLSSRLVSGNIVTVFDSGQTDDGSLYLVMELIDGKTLASVIAASSPITSRRVASIGRQLCDALETAHELGIVHRDLKPHNVMVLSTALGRDQIKVLDFGLAKSITGDSMSQITATHAMLGTPAYMAPEQIENGMIDGRTDLYAVGCILYEMLAGRPPFQAAQITALFAMHLGEAPPPLPADVPPTLARTVMRLLEKSPDARFASAAELRAVLDEVSPATPVTGVPVVSAAALSAARPVAPARRRGLVLGSALALVVALGVGAFVFVTRHTPPAAEPSAVKPTSNVVAPEPPRTPPPPPIAVPSPAAVLVPAPVPAPVTTTPKTTKATKATRPAKHAKPKPDAPPTTTTKPVSPPDELPLAPIRR
ncbi:MAG TPA: serine/threonine-protein kinase [Kofleriaceae bacterium]|nr:serine/threonine-protein kinase [Kofleriaceae bacterium]